MVNYEAVEDVADIGEITASQRQRGSVESIEEQPESAKTRRPGSGTWGGRWEYEIMVDQPVPVPDLHSGRLLRSRAL